MGIETKIEWCSHTFNPWIGCQKVSPGCTHCYAEAMMDHRYGRVKWGPAGTRARTSAANWRQPIKWDRAAAADGVRRRVFCASLADVFEDRPELVPWRLELFELIDRTPHLDWLLLTKRPKNVVDLWAYYERDGRPCFPPGVWVGTSVENQEAAAARIPHLLATPAAVRFLSVEPLLGPVNLGLFRVALPKHRESWPVERVRNFWVIVGSESGKGARPMDEDWVRSIRDQCREAGVPFFYKQAVVDGRKISLPELDGKRWAEFPEPGEVRHAGR